MGAGVGQQSVGSPRRVALYDPAATPASWQEGMKPGEFAVHYSSFEPGVRAPYCTVCGSLAEAEEYARERVRENPELRCRIYDHNGFVGEAVKEVRGERYKGEAELGPRFRRWVGGSLLVCGLLLVGIDWWVDFRYVWPGVLGSRLLIPGFVLVFTEAMVVLHRRVSASRSGR